MADGALEIRPGGPADAERVAAIVAAGFETYRGFAPLGWDPPALAWELDGIRARLAGSDTWSRLALAGGEPVAHIAFVHARASRRPAETLPGLAHLWHLFVVPAWWGTGLATRLHTGAVEEAARRGYTAMRLYTPEAQARARAFYEREGWRAIAPPFHEDRLRLRLVEYLVTLPRPEA